MKKIKYYLLASTLFLFCSNCTAQTTEPSDITNTFLKTYESKSNEALDYIFKTNKFISKDDIESLKNRIKEYEGLLGEFYGSEILIKNRLGESIETHSYIMKYNRQPLRFIVTFYKPNDNWIVYNFKISDDFITELETATIKLSYKE